MPIVIACMRFAMKRQAAEIFADGKTRTLAEVFPMAARASGGPRS